MGAHLRRNKMGISRRYGYNSDDDDYYRTMPQTVVSSGNPDPNNYKLVRAEEAGEYLLLQISYPNCANYEGNKVLVYKGINLIGLVNQKTIDPHFSNNKQFASPIARFVPTEEGWKMAQVFIAGMRSLEKI